MHLLKFYQSKISNRIKLAQVLKNLSWLFFDRGVKVLIGVLVGVWLARYMGPAQFGQLNYAISIIALFGPFVTFGLTDIVVRRIVGNPRIESQVIATAIYIQFVAAVVSFVLLALLALGSNLLDPVSAQAVLILSVQLPFLAALAVKYRFQARLQLKYVVWVENTVLILMALIRALLIFLECELTFFLWAIVAESFLNSAALLLLYKTFHKTFWFGARKVEAIRYNYAMELLRESWPLMISGMAIVLYMRVDQVMLGQIAGAEAVGVYSAALRISEIWYIVPVIILTSVFPVIVETRSSSAVLFERRIRALLNLLASISLGICIAVALAAESVISFVYGEAFRDAFEILFIHIWAVPFVFLGVAGDKWYLLEGMQLHILARTVAGAVLNIALNILLIPRLGGIGAATATVISYGMVAYGFDLCMHRTRHMFHAKTQALFLGPYLFFRYRW